MIVENRRRTTGVYQSLVHPRTLEAWTGWRLGRGTKRRIASTSDRTKGSLAQRWAVRSATQLALAHSAVDLPSAIAEASLLLRLVHFSLDMVPTSTRWQGSTAPPIGPAHGSQPGTQAGRHALEGQGMATGSRARREYVGDWTWFKHCSFRRGFPTPSPPATRSI